MGMHPSELKQILGANSTAAENPEEEPDWEDRLNQVMQSRGRQSNLSFFAFTATPKGKTLELFGRKGSKGTPEAFCLYSMRQAIEEGFILDVVKNYTTYATYYKLVKAVEDDPNLPKKKAAKALAKFMSLAGHLPDHRQAVFSKLLDHLVVRPVRRLEVSQSEGFPVELKAMPQHMQGALGLQLLHQRRDQHRLQPRSVQGLHLLPQLRLGLGDEAAYLRRVESLLFVPLRVGAGLPAIAEQHLLHIGFEGALVGLAHPSVALSRAAHSGAVEK